MIINQSNLADLAKGFKTIFAKALAAASLSLADVYMRVPSSGASETYPLMGAWPVMRKWVGERQHKNIAAYKMTIANETYEATVDLPREAVEDDQYGVYNPSMEAMAQVAKALPDKLVGDLLAAGFAATKGLAYDGQYFFDSDHKDGDGPTQSNVGVAVLDATGLNAGIAAMRKIKMENGEPMELNPTHLVVPPALEAKAIELCETATLSGGGANPQYRRLKVVVCPRLTSDTAWFILDCSKAVKPVLVQERRAPEFVALTGASDDMVFEKNKFTFGASCRYGAGYGLWQLAYGSTGAGA